MKTLVTFPDTINPIYERAVDIEEIYKDIKKIYKYIKKTDIAEEEKFKSNMKSYNFYWQAIKVVTRVFNKMMKNKATNP